MPANKTSSSKAGDQDNEPVFPDGKTGLPTLEDLPAEHRQVYDQTLADLGKEILKRFTWTHNGGVRFIGTAECSLDGIDISVPSEERSRALGQEMNYMIGHALLRQTEVLLNSMDNIVARVVRSVLAGEYQQDTGPVINPHVGEKRFYTRPLNIPQINAPEGTKAEFILYAPEDQNDRPTYYDDPPAFIPEGYNCLLRYRPLRAGEEPPRRPEPIKTTGANTHAASTREKPADQDLLVWQALYSASGRFTNSTY